MEDLKLTKWTDKTRDDGVGGVTLTRDGLKNLEISFAGNLDLYFTLKNCNSFIIGRNFNQVYEAFDNLFYELATGKIYEPLSEIEIDLLIDNCFYDGIDYHEELAKMEQEEKRNFRKFQREAIISGLLKDNVIIWYSDEFPIDVAPFFKIIRMKDYFIIQFGLPNIERTLNLEEEMAINDYKYAKTISVRIRNSGSRYTPFNVSFMRLYHNLMEISEQCRQVHIKEYLLEQQILKRKLNK